MERLTREQLEELRRFDTPTVCNAIERFKIRPNSTGFMMPGMVVRTPLDKPMVGYAATARVSGAHPGSPESGERLIGYYEHVREMADPTIAVIQDIDAVQFASFWGEVQATTHLALGAVGTIVDGGVRDLNEAAAIGFHFFSTKVAVSHGYIHVESFGHPVDMLGLTIHPGDLLHADMHGVTVIPHEIAAQLANACRAVAAAELEMLDPCRQAIRDGRKPSLDELREWRRNMASKRNG